MYEVFNESFWEKAVREGIVLENNNCATIENMLKWTL